MTDRYRRFGVSLEEALTIIAAGGSPKRIVVNGFGKNVSAAAGEAIMEPGAAYPYLAYAGTPLAMRVKAGGNAADDTGGTGAREVTFVGLDGSFHLASEAEATAGASASTATTTTFSRLLGAYVSGAGTGRTNAAAVTIEDSGGGADYAAIVAGESAAALGFFTVPAGYRGYLVRYAGTTAVAIGTASVVLEAWWRPSANDTSVPVGAMRLFNKDVSMARGTGPLVHEYREPLVFDEYSDIWWEATPSSTTPEVTVEYTLLLEAK